MTRGWRRPDTAEPAARTALLEQLRALGLESEDLRRQARDVAVRRQDAVLALYDGGLSVRAMAAELALSPAVVQELLRQARLRTTPPPNGRS